MHSSQWIQANQATIMMARIMSGILREPDLLERVSSGDIAAAKFTTRFFFNSVFFALALLNLAALDLFLIDETFGIAETFLRAYVVYLAIIAAFCVKTKELTIGEASATIGFGAFLLVMGYEVMQLEKWHFFVFAPVYFPVAFYLQGFFLGLIFNFAYVAAAIGGYAIHIYWGGTPIPPEVIITIIDGCLLLFAFVAVFEFARMQLNTQFDAIYEEMASNVHKDAETGLPNRKKMAIQLDEEYARVVSIGGSAAFAWFEISTDNWSIELVRTIIAEIRALSRSSDTVARMSETAIGILAIERNSDELVRTYNQIVNAHKGETRIGFGTADLDPLVYSESFMILKDAENKARVQMRSDS